MSIKAILIQGNRKLALFQSVIPTPVRGVGRGEVQVHG